MLPAIEKITSNLFWEDLVLQQDDLQKLSKARAWLKEKNKNKQEKGLIIIFYGPQGNNKQISAALLAKDAGNEVYRIDLSQVVSKYIGETEKNLEKIFKEAEEKHWILFFDEADALFGKRTEVQDAHDKYANQEVSYLLERLEHFHGLTIFGLKTEESIDEVFKERAQLRIHFPKPGPR